MAMLDYRSVCIQNSHTWREIPFTHHHVGYQNEPPLGSNLFYHCLFPTPCSFSGTSGTRKSRIWSRDMLSPFTHVEKTVTCPHVENAKCKKKKTWEPKGTPPMPYFLGGVALGGPLRLPWKKILSLTDHREKPSWKFHAAGPGDFFGNGKFRDPTSDETIWEFENSWRSGCLLSWEPKVPPQSYPPQEIRP